MLLRNLIWICCAGFIASCASSPSGDMMAKKEEVGSIELQYANPELRKPASVKGGMSTSPHRYYY